MPSLIASGLVPEPPVLGTRVRVWLTAARYPGTQYEGHGVVRSIDPVDGVPNQVRVECIVQTDAPVPDTVVVWTISKWEPTD